MPRGPNQRTLTVYLMNEGVDDPEAIVRSGAKRHAVRIGGRNIADLHVKVGEPHPPTWVTFFEGTTLDLSDVQGMSTGAVLLVGANRRLFAVTFGFGHLMLQSGVADERFGLKVTLNAVDHNQIRSVDRETLDSATPHSQIQASRATSITDFGLNIEQDMLRAVTGTPATRRSGSDSRAKTAYARSVRLRSSAFWISSHASSRRARRTTTKSTSRGSTTSAKSKTRTSATSSTTSFRND